MKLNSLKNIFKGASGDSFFLMFVRVVTLFLGIIMTRVLSEHFSLQDYGTYSQVILLSSTISSVTILGMMDGINFFFCREKEEKRRNAYISTVFSLQYFVNIVSTVVVLICAVPISRYFDNEALRPLIIFVALLPVLQNSISLLQIMFIAVGKAKLIAVRNLLISVLKLIAICMACYLFDNIVVLLIFQLLTDIAQVIYFTVVLRKNNCKINVLWADVKLIKEILVYCIPMAMFAVIKSLNRDSDKFVISYFTDTETLAVYTNASKLLPFDILMTSFCTVLLPYITRFIAEKRKEFAHKVYKSFLELSYISTIILAMGAICVAPELMRFLYTDKYVSHSFSVPVFIIYILVDIFSVMNITLVLSAAGKTKTILYASLGSFFLNIVLNIGLFFGLQEIGPAVATLIVTVLQGVIILSLSAKTLGSNFIGMFNLKYLSVFICEVIGASFFAICLRRLFVSLGVPSFVILISVYGIFSVLMLLLNAKRVIGNLGVVNSCKSGC